MTRLTGGRVNSLSTAPRIPDGACCIDCGYLLRGLDSCHCPECGREFDPTDPSTVNVGLPMGRVARWGVGPSGSVSHVLLGTYLALCVWIAFLPIYYVGAALMVSYLTVLIGILFWMRSLLRRWMVRKYRQPPEFLRADDLFRRRGRAVFVTMMLLIMTQLPLRALFLVTRPAMARLEREVMESPLGSANHSRQLWLGTFHLQPTRDCVHGFEADAHMGFLVGDLRFDPDGAHAENSWTYIGFGWYLSDQWFLG